MAPITCIRKASPRGRFLVIIVNIGAFGWSKVYAQAKLATVLRDARGRLVSAAAGPAAAAACPPYTSNQTGTFRVTSPPIAGIGYALAAGLDVAREAILEGRVLLDRDDEVIPTVELFQGPVVRRFPRRAG